MRASLTVLTHRGLSPHQFTPMSGAHKSVERMAAGGAYLPIRALATRRHRSPRRLAVPRYMAQMRKVLTVVMLASVLGCSHISGGRRPDVINAREQKLQDEVESLQAVVKVLKRQVEKLENIAKIGKPPAQVQAEAGAAREKAYSSQQRIRDLEALKEILNREYEALMAQVKALDRMAAGPY